MTSVPLFGLHRGSPSVLGELRELLFPVSNSILVHERGDARGGIDLAGAAESKRTDNQIHLFEANTSRKKNHNMGRDPSESADLDNSKITLPQMMIVAINFLIPYLTTLAEGLAGVKAEVAPRDKREAKRVLKGAMVKVCDALGQVQRESKRGVSCRSKRSALQSISMT